MLRCDVFGASYSEYALRESRADIAQRELRSGPGGQLALNRTIYMVLITANVYSVSLRQESKLKSLPKNKHSGIFTYQPWAL